MLIIIVIFFNAFNYVTILIFKLKSCHLIELRWFFLKHNLIFSINKTKIIIKEYFDFCEYYFLSDLHYIFIKTINSPAFRFKSVNWAQILICQTIFWWNFIFHLAKYIFSSIFALLNEFFTTIAITFRFTNLTVLLVAKSKV